MIACRSIVFSVVSSSASIVSRMPRPGHAARGGEHGQQADRAAGPPPRRRSGSRRPRRRSGRGRSPGRRPPGRLRCSARAARAGRPSRDRPTWWATEDLPKVHSMVATAQHSHAGPETQPHARQRGPDHRRGAGRPALGDRGQRQLAGDHQQAVERDERPVDGHRQAVRPHRQRQDGQVLHVDQRIEEGGGEEDQVAAVGEGGGVSAAGGAGAACASGGASAGRATATIPA